MNHILEVPDSLLMLNREIEEQNLLSVVTPEEVRMLFQGERRDRMFSTRRDVWTTAERLAKLQMRVCCDGLLKINQMDSPVHSTEDAANYARATLMALTNAKQLGKE